MKTFCLALVLLLAAGPQSLRAQCLPLADMLAAGAEPTALTAPQAVAKHLAAEWSYRAPTATSREAFWAFPAAEGLALPVARLSVRAQRPGQDVVLKTADASCIRNLRGELKSKKLTAEPVTCLDCEGVRFKAPDFEATIYSQMKGDYPFVVVVHQVPPVAVAPPAKDSVVNQKPD